MRRRRQTLRRALRHQPGGSGGSSSQGRGGCKCAATGGGKGGCGRLSEAGSRDGGTEDRARGQLRQDRITFWEGRADIGDPRREVLRNFMGRLDSHPPPGLGTIEDMRSDLGFLFYRGVTGGVPQRR